MFAPSQSRGRSDGFTLFELLISVAVIAVLCLLGVSSFRTAVDNSRSAKCVANLRAIAAGTLSFTVDRDGMLWKQEDVGYSSYRMLMDPLGAPELLKGYVPGKNVWMCPAGRATLKIFENNYAWTSADQFDTKPYALAGTFSKTAIYWDAYNYSLPSMHGAFEPPAGGPPALKAQFQYKPHKGKKHVNWAFADGHVISGATAAQ